MSATTASIHDDGTNDATGWADELATYLGPSCFPTTHDHLAATLISRHAPSHLLWHLSVLPRSREIGSLEQLRELLRLMAPPLEQEPPTT